LQEAINNAGQKKIIKMLKLSSQLCATLTMMVDRNILKASFRLTLNASLRMGLRLGNTSAIVVTVPFVIPQCVPFFLVTTSLSIDHIGVNLQYTHIVALQWWV